MRSASYRSSLASAVIATLLSCGACGGDAEPPPRTQADVSSPEQKRFAAGVQTSSEIGGLNEEQVDATFKRSLGALETCLGQGAERLEYLGGSVAFFLKIGPDGKVAHAHVEESTLGDRQTEKCMLSALRAKTWPKPVGGDVGLARKSFDFDPPNDVRPPTEWGSENAEPAIEKIADAVAECKSGSSGTFEATVYVDTDGSVLAASVTPPDESGEQAVDCLVEALGSAEFSSPGSWPAKVTFSL